MSGPKYIVLSTSFPREVKEGLINPVSYLPVGGFGLEEAEEYASTHNYFISVIGVENCALMIVEGKEPIMFISYPPAHMRHLLRGLLSSMSSASTSVRYVASEFFKNPDLSSREAVELAKEKYRRDYRLDEDIEVDDSMFDTVNPEIFRKYADFVMAAPEETKAVLERYVGLSGLINDDLRSGIRSPKIEGILDLFRKGPRVTEQIKLYRGMSSEIIESLTDEGLISTSYTFVVATRFASNDCCIYEIFLNPGDYTILPLFEILNRNNEREILLPPGGTFVRTGTSIKAVRPGQKMKFIQVVFIPPGAKTI